MTRDCRKSVPHSEQRMGQSYRRQRCRGIVAGDGIIGRIDEYFAP
jgi:hypothetical protein